MVVSLRGDLRFGNARSVHALTKNRHGLIELLTGDGLAVFLVCSEQNLCSALQVECEFWRPRRIAAVNAESDEAGQTDDERKQKMSSVRALFTRRRALMVSRRQLSRFQIYGAAYGIGDKLLLVEVLSSVFSTAGTSSISPLASSAVGAVLLLRVKPAVERRVIVGGEGRCFVLLNGCIYRGNDLTDGVAVHNDWCSSRS